MKKKIALGLVAFFVIGMAALRVHFEVSGIFQSDVVTDVFDTVIFCIYAFTLCLQVKRINAVELYDLVIMVAAMVTVIALNAGDGVFELLAFVAKVLCVTWIVQYASLFNDESRRIAALPKGNK